MNLKLRLADAPDLTLGTLDMAIRPFSVHCGCLDPDSMVEVFNVVSLV